MKNSNLPRRDFLTMVASGAAALGAGTLAAPASPAKADPLLRQTDAAAGFEAWLGKIKGTHRQVLDSPEPNGGFAFAWARIFLMSNTTVGVPETDCASIVIVRHNSLPFSMGDALWAKYKFGEKFHIDDKATGQPAVRNTWYKPKPGEVLMESMAIDKLVESGVHFGVCDMALTVYSKMFAEDMKADPAEVKKEWVAGVLPGYQIVPSGVLALNRLQEMGCSYVFAG